MRILFTPEQIATRIKDLGAEIRRDAGDREIVLLGVLKGAAVFLTDLLRAIPGAVRFEFIDKVQDFSDNTIADAMEIDFFNHADLTGKHVYLLKDIVSTGVIEAYLLTQLRASEPASLKLVALLDRPELRTADVQVDYFGFKVDDGTFVGYGLEQQASRGNLPFIATL